MKLYVYIESMKWYVIRKSNPIDIHYYDNVGCGYWDIDLRRATKYNKEDDAQKEIKFFGVGEVFSFDEAAEEFLH